MTDLPLPPWPDDPPTGGPHAGPGPVLAGLMLLGAVVTVVLVVAALGGAVALLLWIGGNW